MSLAAPLSPDVLDALFLPLATGQLQPRADAPVLFAGARMGPALRAHARAGWLCEQGFRPFAQALEAGGLAVGEPAAEDRFGQVLLLPPRQREARQAAFARALSRLAPGGTLLACVPNAEGGRSAEDDLRRLAGPVQGLAKHKCRVFWVAPAEGAVDRALQAAWTAHDAVRRNTAGYLSRPGLFAWDRIDAASALLARHLPADLHGAVADLGAGYGYLATEVVARCPGVRAIDLYEADARALVPAGANLAEAVARSGRAVATAIHWHDVTAGLPARYDAVVCNPPFHQGRADLPALGRAFIEAAAAALRPGGRLWLVANRHLPYEATLRQHFAQVRAHADEAGFKVIEAVKA